MFAKLSLSKKSCNLAVAWLETSGAPAEDAARRRRWPPALVDKAGVASGRAAASPTRTGPISQEKPEDPKLGVRRSPMGFLGLDASAEPGIAEFPLSIAGHSWTVGCTTLKDARTGRITLLQGEEFGYTRSVDGILKAIAGVRWLDQWARTWYWGWFQEHVLCFHHHDC
ncbi:hypothetical protein GGR56DRAFT_76129 [Xylariaceae sp. FL0804]|nr:hypothetical protein GGR56DRAFT_76129 [Xylariaceae sp. FL0804]